MFISLSKTIARFGGFRLGIGVRLNKKNSMGAFLVLFLAGMFQLIWGIMILCGWVIYAIFYGLYWCIKKTISISSKNKRNRRSKNTTSNQQIEIRKEIPIMTPEMNSPSNENPKNQSPKKKSTAVRWIVGGFFAMFTLVNGFHFSSLFLLCSSFLMLPLPFMETFWQKKNIKAIVAIILSVVLFFVGVLASPNSESTTPSNDITQTTTNGSITTSVTTSTTTSATTSTTTPNSSTSNNSGTTELDNTTTENEKVEMVWVASSGTKYHSKSSCSNMNAPRKISLEDAKNQGYTACKKCH